MVLFSRGTSQKQRKIKLVAQKYFFFYICKTFQVYLNQLEKQNDYELNWN